MASTLALFLRRVSRSTASRTYCIASRTNLLYSLKNELLCVVVSSCLCSYPFSIFCPICTASWDTAGILRREQTRPVVSGSAHIMLSAPRPQSKTEVKGADLILVSILHPLANFFFALCVSGGAFAQSSSQANRTSRSIKSKKGRSGEEL